MTCANESRVWVALACLVTATLGLLIAMFAMSSAGASLPTVAYMGLGSVAFAALAARIAVKFSRH